MSSIYRSMFYSRVLHVKISGPLAGATDKISSGYSRVTLEVPQVERSIRRRPGHADYPVLSLPGTEAVLESG